MRSCKNVPIIGVASSGFCCREGQAIARNCVTALMLEDEDNDDKSRPREERHKETISAEDLKISASK
jgi:hypothetical protein